MFRSKYFYITLCLGFCVGFLPTLIHIAVLGTYPKIPIEIADDTLYYLARIREVSAGHIFIGNPYLLTHVHDITTSFFVADWIYAIPFFILGVFHTSLVISLACAEVFWSIATTFLLYVLYSNLGMEDKYRPWASALSLISVFLFVIRPVGMSVIFPCFLLVMICFLNLLKDIRNNKNVFYFVISVSLSFYVYTYLWQFAVVLLSLYFLYVVIVRENYKRMFIILGSVCVLTLPVFIYTWKQIHSQFYFETLSRVGLVNTHTIGISGFIYSMVILISLSLLYMCTLKNIIGKHEYIFFSITFVALGIAGASNVISGKDLEVAVHVGRFTELYISIFLSYIFSLSCYSKIGKRFFVLGGIIFLYVSYLVYSNYLVMQNALKDNTNNDEYSRVIIFLNNEPKEQTIFSDSTLGAYVVAMTQDYVLFHPNAELYLASNKEIEERYLVSHIFSDITLDTLKKDYRQYAGVGNAVHHANIINRKVKICRVVRRIFPNLSCDQEVTPYLLAGDQYFNNLLSEYKYIQKNKEDFLHTYGVGYIVVDRVRDNWNMSSLKTFSIVKDDGRFIIYKRKK